VRFFKAASGEDTDFDRNYAILGHDILSISELKNNPSKKAFHGRI
jgi:hypothetical protein